MAAAATRRRRIAWLLVGTLPLVASIALLVAVPHRATGPLHAAAGVVVVTALAEAARGAHALSVRVLMALALAVGFVGLGVQQMRRLPGELRQRLATEREARFGGTPEARVFTIDVVLAREAGSRAAVARLRAALHDRRRGWGALLGMLDPWLDFELGPGQLEPVTEPVAVARWYDVVTKLDACIEKQRARGRSLERAREKALDALGSDDAEAGLDAGDPSGRIVAALAARDAQVRVTTFQSLDRELRGLGAHDAWRAAFVLLADEEDTWTASVLRRFAIVALEDPTLAREATLALLLADRGPDGRLFERASHLRPNRSGARLERGLSPQQQVALQRTLTRVLLEGPPAGRSGEEASLTEVMLLERAWEPMSPLETLEAFDSGADPIRRLFALGWAIARGPGSPGTARAIEKVADSHRASLTERSVAESLLEGLGGEPTDAARGLAPVAPGTVEVLLALLKDPSSTRRRIAAARALRGRARPTDERALLATLEAEGDVPVKVALLETLAHLPASLATALEMLEARVRSSTDEDVCVAAIDALGRIGPPAEPAADALEAVASSSNPRTRQAALRALQRIRAP